MHAAPLLHPEGLEWAGHRRWVSKELTKVSLDQAGGIQGIGCGKEQKGWPVGQVV